MVARNRIVISGTLGAGAVEEWSCGINFADGGAGLVTAPATLAAWAQAIKTYMAGLPSTNFLRLGVSAAGTTNQVAAYYYPSSGPALAVGYSDDSGIIGINGPTKPPQCSLVLTLLTQNAGRRYRGRVYWPCLNGNISTGLKVSGIGDPDGDFAALLNTISATGGDVVPAVYSTVGDFLTPVSSVRAGDVIDTQRRRRDGLTEVYTSTPI